MTKNKSAEDCLREAFTEELIKTGLYPDALLRPRIYNAMREFAAQELADYKSAIEELLPIAENAPIDYINFGKAKQEAIIDRARKLIDKL